MSSVNYVSGGLDVLGIVDNLIYVEREPIRKLEKKNQSYQDQVSAYQSFNSKLLALKTSIEGLLYNGASVPLSFPTDFETRLANSVFASRLATSSDESVLTATAKNGNVTGTFSVTVNSLATHDSYSSNGIDAITGTETRTGTLVIRKGTGDPVTITIDSTNNTLAGIRSAINNANAGVTASIINDGSAAPYRLVLTSNDSGTANSLNITNNLNQGSGTALTLAETVTPADAEIVVNGITIISSSNTVTDAVEGVTFNLKQISATPVAVTIERDLDSIVEAVTDLISKYNDVNSYINSQFKYDAAKKKAGILAGDFTLRDAQQKLNSALTTSVSSDGAALKVLSQIGIDFSNDGALKLDETKFRNSLEDNFTGTAHVLLADALDGSGNTVSVAPKLFSQLKSLTDPLDGSLFRAQDALNKNIARLDDQISDMEERLDARRELLIAEFAKADFALRQLSSLQASLTGQVASLKTTT